jgi:hypothetical protein
MGVGKIEMDHTYVAMDFPIRFFIAEIFLKWHLKLWIPAGLNFPTNFFEVWKRVTKRLLKQMIPLYKFLLLLSIRTIFFGFCSKRLKNSMNSELTDYTYCGKNIFSS